MSLRRSFLPRRNLSRSLTFSKASRESKVSETCVRDLRDDCCIVNGRNEYGEESGGAVEESGCGDTVSWANMLPEILGDIIRRVEASEERWPSRQNVVACGCVCKRWREVTLQTVKSSLHAGKITFPSCLKQVLQFGSRKSRWGWDPSQIRKKMILIIDLIGAYLNSSGDL